MKSPGGEHDLLRNYGNAEMCLSPTVERISDRKVCKSMHMWQAHIHIIIMAMLQAFMWTPPSEITIPIVWVGLV